MKWINVLLTLLSLNAVLVVLERLSPTTTIILQPYNFLRVHEVVQITILIAFSFVISFLLLKHVTKEFELLKTRKGTMLGILFVLGLYFTASGNGLHEMASYLFNQFCSVSFFIPHAKDTGTPITNLTVCGSMYFNDYFTGNILYFVGLFMGNITLILFERQNPEKKMKPKQRLITSINGLVFAATFVAYAAFDPVWVGMWFLIITTIIIDTIFFLSKKRYTTLPFTFYCAIGYSVSCLLTLFLRIIVLK